jgi:hypothetical protein
MQQLQKNDNNNQIIRATTTKWQGQQQKQSITINK